MSVRPFVQYGPAGGGALFKRDGTPNPVEARVCLFLALHLTGSAQCHRQAFFWSPGPFPDDDPDKCSATPPSLGRFVEVQFLLDSPHHTRRLLL